MQEYLIKACGELELDIFIPFRLELADGNTLQAEALLPHLGAPKGMIIVSDYNSLLNIAAEIQNMGYGYSVLDEPLPAEVYDIESYKEMFSDWGWNSTEKEKPVWIED